MASPSTILSPSPQEPITVIIVHRWGGSPSADWYVWLKEQLIPDGVRTLILEMPDPSCPHVEAWPTAIGAAIANNKVSLGSKTFLVGHSVGCQAVLRYLAQLGPVGARVGGALLVAVWFTIDKAWPTIEPWITTPLDLAAVRLGSAQFRGLISDNDQYTADHAATTKHFLSRLSGGLAPATIQLITGAKHFNDSPQPAVLAALRHMINVSQSGITMTSSHSSPMVVARQRSSSNLLASSGLGGTTPHSGAAGNVSSPILSARPPLLAQTSTVSNPGAGLNIESPASGTVTSPEIKVDPWAPQPCPYIPMNNLGPGSSQLLAIGKWPAPVGVQLEVYAQLFKKYIFDHLITFPQLLNSTLGVDEVANSLVSVTSWSSWEGKEAATSGPLWRDQIMALVRAAGGGDPPVFVNLPVYSSIDAPKPPRVV